MIDGTGAVFAGAVGLGLLHGLEPGHGWPLAATYGLARPRRFLAGLGAAVLLGFGHLISSIAVVLVFFAAKEGFGLDELAWLPYVAGGLLIALGLWELRPRRGHGHSHGHGHGHSHGQQQQHQPHSHEGDPGTGPGLWSLAGSAFVLGFAHEEEIEIIGLCAGSDLCLELMLAYALTVILAIAALTLLLIAGYQRWRHRLEHWAPHLPKVTAAILIALGLGFIAGWV